MYVRPYLETPKSKCVHTHMRTHTHTNIDMYTHLHTYRSACTKTYEHLYTHVKTNTNACANTYNLIATGIYKYIYDCKHTRMYMHTFQTYAETQAHKHIYKYNPIYTHTDTHL